MFQVRGPILRVFQLVLRIFSKPISDAFHKSFGIAAILAEESLELFLWYNNIGPFFLSMSAFVLCPAGTNTVIEKRSRKRGAVVSIGYSRITMIFTLLAEPIAVQMQFAEIKVGKTALKDCFFGSFWGVQTWTKSTEA